MTGAIVRSRQGVLDGRVGRRNATFVLAAVAAVSLAARIAAPWIGSRLGTYLVVDEPLRPSAAIVVLAGGFPDREDEAVQLYAAGYAPYVVLIREWLGTEEQRTRPEHRDWIWEGRLNYLQRRGVPASAIVTVERTSCMTYDELQLASQIVESLPVANKGTRERDSRVILVSSAYHTRRVQFLWNVIQADRDPEARQPALVHAAPERGFSADAWWTSRRSTMRVAREYVGLVTARLPLAGRTAPCGADYKLTAQVFSWLLG
ncbi:MAG: YdcF family protein [Chloroflexota bacterium]